MFERFRIRIGGRTASARVPLNVSLASIGILQRIDDHHDVVENACSILIAQQRAGHEHRRLGGRRLVAVHAEAEPGHSRSRTGDFRGTRRRRGIGIGQRHELLTDRVESRVIPGRGEHGQNERAVLIGLPELLDGDQIRSLRQLVEVVENARVRRKAIAELVSEKLVGRRHLSVRGGGQSGDEQKRCETSDHSLHLAERILCSINSFRSSAQC